MVRHTFKNLAANAARFLVCLTILRHCFTYIIWFYNFDSILLSWYCIYTWNFLIPLLQVFHDLWQYLNYIRYFCLSREILNTSLPFDDMPYIDNIIKGCEGIFFTVQSARMHCCPLTSHFLTSHFLINWLLKVQASI